MLKMQSSVSSPESIPQSNYVSGLRIYIYIYIYMEKKLTKQTMPFMFSRIKIDRAP
jgi:hypothetical protein